MAAMMAEWMAVNLVVPKAVSWAVGQWGPCLDSEPPPAGPAAGCGAQAGTRSRDVRCSDAARPSVQVSDAKNLATAGLYVHWTLGAVSGRRGAIAAAGRNG